MGNLVRFAPYANLVYKITYDRDTGEHIDVECANAIPAPIPVQDMYRWKSPKVSKNGDSDWTLEQAREYLEGI